MGHGFWPLFRAHYSLAVSPFNLIYKVMEEVGEKVGRILSEETSRDKIMRETREETTMRG